VPELNDQERVALLTARLGLPAARSSRTLLWKRSGTAATSTERSLAPGREVLRSNERLEFLGDASSASWWRAGFTTDIPMRPKES